MDSLAAAAPAKTRGPRYDYATIAVHWATALLVVVLWTIGQTVDFVPKGPDRTDYISLHVVLGATLGVLILARLAWQVTGATKPPPLDRGLLLFGAKAVHGLLYLLLIAVVALGATFTWIRGDEVFGLVQFTSFAPDDRALRRSIAGWHELVANTILIVAGLHAAAGLFHHYVWKDSTLRRMLPCFRKDCAHHHH